MDLADSCAVYLGIFSSATLSKSRLVPIEGIPLPPQRVGMILTSSLSFYSLQTKLSKEAPSG